MSNAGDADDLDNHAGHDDVSVLESELLSSLLAGIGGLPGTAVGLSETVGVICLRTNIAELDDAVRHIDDAISRRAHTSDDGARLCLTFAHTALVAARTVRTLLAVRTPATTPAVLGNVDLGECSNLFCDNAGEIPLHSKTVEENGVRHASECAWCLRHFSLCDCPEAVPCPDCDCEGQSSIGKGLARARRQHGAVACLDAVIEKMQAGQTAEALEYAAIWSERADHIAAGIETWYDQQTASQHPNDAAPTPTAPSGPQAEFAPATVTKNVPAQRT